MNSDDFFPLAFLLLVPPVVSLPAEAGRCTFDVFLRDYGDDMQETTVGESFGPTWSTHWFLVKATVPESWAGQTGILS